MKILTKLLLLVLSVSAIVYLFSLGYVSFTTRRMAFDDAKLLANSYAREYANLAMSNLNIDVGITRSVAATFLNYDQIPYENRQKIYDDILKNIYIVNPGYLSVWTSWELSAYQPGYTEDFGRLRTVVRSIADGIEVERKYLNMEGDEGVYYEMKTSSKEDVTNPYFYSYTDAVGESILETSFAVPIIENDKFIGLAGLDIPLTKYQQIIEDFKPFETGYAFMVANDGTLVGHPDKNNIGEKIALVYPDLEKNFNITQKIGTGLEFAFTTESSADSLNNYFSFAPVHIGKSVSKWSLAVVVPIKTITQHANQHFYLSVGVALISLLILTFVIGLVSSAFTRPLKKITRILSDLAKGDIDESKKMSIKSKDEIGKMRVSVNSLIDGLKNTAEFAHQIGIGNLDAKYNLLSDHDVLGSALIEMQKSLKHAKLLDEKSKKETQDRSWTAQGLAKFGEILQTADHENMEEFCYTIINNLVRYTKSNMGVFFLVNDADKQDIHLKRTASIAYDTRKYIEQRIETDENVIGRCFKEKASIYMNDIPDDYIKINSGLGEAPPKSILVMPLIFNEEVFGVVELASFNEFEQFEIEFVQKSGESIAATISTIKASRMTSELLEETQLKSQEYEAQEEELRQNNEELIATQEEMMKQKSELENSLAIMKAQELVFKKRLAEKEAELKSRQ